MSTTHDTRGLRENLQAWLVALNTKDTESLCSLYDPESLYANAAAPLARGISAIRPRYENAFQMVEGTLLTKEESFFQGEDMALLVGKYYFKPPNESDAKEDTGRVALVYHRTKDDRWLLLFDMDNTPPDAVIEDFM